MFHPTALSLLLLSIGGLSLGDIVRPGVLRLNAQKIYSGPERVPRLIKERQIQVPDQRPPGNLIYLIDLDIGTPPQSTQVQLDTGSSDLIVETSSSDICSAAPPNPCTNYGPYNANASATYLYIDSDFQVAYGGADGATGDWGSDTVKVGGATLQAAQFGVMYKTTVPEGIVGVGYQQIEARVDISGKPQYDNFPVLLVKQGYIASRAFSLWTNDDRASSGPVLFGGVDTAKFSGNLVFIDLIASGFDGLSEVVDFTIPLNSVSGTNTDGTTTTFTNGATVHPVLMDTGTSLTNLEDTLVESIWTFAGATPYTTSPDSAYILCSAGSDNKFVNLAFAGITINVPLSQLVVFPDSNNQFCVFGIRKAGADTYIIGDTVLSSMYVVYDLDNKQLALAPTVSNATGEHIVAIKAGPCGVPGSPTSKCTTTTTTTTSKTSTTTRSTKKSKTTTTVHTSTPTSPVPGYKYLGCYTDSLEHRALIGSHYSNTGKHGVTNTKCIEYCEARGYALGGSENGDECFCGHKFNPSCGTRKVQDWQCNLPCRGNQKQICGGKKRLSMFKKK